MRRIAVPVVALALVAIACGVDAGGSVTSTTARIQTTTTSTTSAPTTTVPTEDVTTVLTLGFEGGFAPIEAVYAPLPQYVLLSDGRLVYQGPVIAIFPGPLMPNLQVAQLTDEEVAELLALVEEIGLPEMVDERDDSVDNVADAPDTVAIYYDENGTHRYAVYALGITDAATSGQVAALQELVDLAGSLSATAEQAGVYVVDRLHIVIGGDFGASDEEGATVVPWPLSTPLSDFTNVYGDLQLRCAVFEDEAADEAVAELQTANQLTFWQSDGENYRPIPRPLFPGEAGCPTF